MGRKFRRLRRDNHAFGLFVVETKAQGGRWSIRSSRCDARSAQDYAWKILTREGGAVRVRQGNRIVAEGSAAENSRSVDPR